MPSAIVIQASGPPTMIRFCQRLHDLPRILNALYVGSLVAVIGDIIERHMVETGFLIPAETLVAKAVGQPVAGASATRLGPLCPKCSQPGLVREAGCLSCVHCGWSKCS